MHLAPNHFPEVVLPVSGFTIAGCSYRYEKIGTFEAHNANLVDLIEYWILQYSIYEHTHNYSSANVEEPGRIFERRKTLLSKVPER
jgi:hypothetical protein